MSENKFWILFWLIICSYFIADNYIDYLEKKSKSEFEIKNRELEVQANSLMFRNLQEELNRIKETGETK